MHSDSAHRRSHVLMRHFDCEEFHEKIESAEFSFCAGAATTSSSEPDVVYTRVEKDGVALITIDNPPVNQLSARVLEGLRREHTSALEDPRVRAIVIYGSGGKFVAGADISLIQKMQQKNMDFTPFVREQNEMMNGFENASKPTVVAIDGVCLGGGLELSMACAARICTPTSQLGLPELQLGLIPGFGGTQRLPRLVGVQKSLEMMLLSKHISGSEAGKIGLVDAVVSKDQLIREASTLALNIASGKSSRRYSLQLSDRLEPAAMIRQIALFARDQAEKKSPNVPFPFECIDVVETGAIEGSGIGLQKEQEAFVRLSLSDSAKALVHFFFAQRGVSKVPGVTDQGVTPRRMSKLGIVGGGLMGSGIAVASLLNGMTVFVKEINEQAAKACSDKVIGILKGRLDSNRLSKQQFDSCVSRFSAQTAYDGFDTIDIVIEAVIEKIELKQRVFADLERVCNKDCILATNTSTIDVEVVGGLTSSQDRVVGLHFFSPAHIMPLLEIVRTQHTSIQVLVDSLAFGKQIRKTSVIVGNCSGFVVNRVFFPYGEASHFLVDRGADLYHIDKVIQEFGMPMGPFRMTDLAGVDVLKNAYTLMGQSYSDRYYPCHAARILVESGRCGEKTGAGFYKHDAKKKRAMKDPAINAFLEQARKESGSPAMETFSDDDIVEIIFFPLINEACRVLEEGMASSGSDIDVSSVLAMGFPAYRGGILKFGELVGVRYVYERLSALYQKYNVGMFEPCEYLKRCAVSGASLYDLSAGRKSSGSVDAGDDIVIVSCCRTAVCRAFKGQFKDTRPDDLLAAVLEDVIKRAPGVSPSDVEDIVVGTVLPKGDQGAIDARVAGLLAGFPEETSVRTLNRLCSSGLQAIADVAAAIRSGYYNIGIAAGVESMSTNPMLWEPSVNPRAEGSISDAYLSMGMTSENVSAKFGISRAEQDLFAAESHRRAAEAIRAGRFADEITPVTTSLKDPKTGETKQITVTIDDGVREDTTMQVLSALRPVFKKNGSSTAGNSSQMSDGASAVLLMKRSQADLMGLRPKAVLRSFAIAGVPPAIMGVGPAAAIPKALAQAGLTVDQIDLFEINEAFASQCTYCLNELQIDRSKVNVNGGAIALGHPLGCTGAKLTTQLCYQAPRCGARYGLVSMCVGTGMGAAAVFEFE